MLDLSRFLNVHFMDFSFVTEYIKVEVKSHTTSKKIRSSEKSCCSKQVPLIKIRPKIILSELSFPVFLKNLNTERGVKL